LESLAVASHPFQQRCAETILCLIFADRGGERCKKKVRDDENALVSP